MLIEIGSSARICSSFVMMVPLSCCPEPSYCVPPVDLRCFAISSGPGHHEIRRRLPLSVAESGFRGRADRSERRPVIVVSTARGGAAGSLALASGPALVLWLAGQGHEPLFAVTRQGLDPAGDFVEHAAQHNVSSVVGPCRVVALVVLEQG